MELEGHGRVAFVHTDGGLQRLAVWSAHDGTVAEIDVPHTMETLRPEDVEHARAIVRKAASLPKPLVIIVPFTAPQSNAAAAETLRSEREAETARATSLQPRLTAFSQESAQTIAALTKERDTAIGSLVQKTSLADELEASRNQLQASSNQLQERVGKLEAELQEARRSVALSLKLQAQRNADLDDLQARYRESQEVQERQRQLLERLGERLGVASRYFHQLADERGKA